MSSNSTIDGWVPVSGGRGTWSILWPCLSTLFLALWVSWHPMAPGTKPDSFHFAGRIMYAILCILLPEISLVFAVPDLMNSLDFQQEVQNLGSKCSLTQAFYVTMGGYATIVPSEISRDGSGLEDDEFDIPRGFRILLPSHILWLTERQMLIWPGHHTHRQPLDDEAAGSTYELTSDNDQVLTAPESVELPESPLNKSEEQTAVAVDNSNKDVQVNTILVTTPSSEPIKLLNTAQIKRRGNANGIAKLIVIIQSSWFVLNCIFRGAHHLPLAPLEILTLTIIVCSITSYVFWWYKPYNVSHSTQLDLPLSVDQWETLKNVSQTKTWPVLPMDNTEFEKHEVWAILLVLIFMINGALHFIAWNGSFPTETEQIIWRVVAIALVALPVLLVASNFIWSGMVTLCVLFMILAKLYVLVESFAAFRSMPAAMYDTWEPSNYFFSFF